MTLPANLDLDTIGRRLAANQPVTHPPSRPWQAATAMVFTPGQRGPELVFIRRAERRGDRFSGDMALPGGVRSPADDDLSVTAARETEEEVGIELPAPAGRLDDLRGRTRRGLVATYGFVLDHQPQLHPAPAEVAEALWIPLHALFDPAASTSVRWAGIPFPAIDYQGRVIWGLTHRMLQTLGAVLGVELATR